MRRSQGLAKNKNGFSLIELLVVIALIALISVFALPNVSSYFKLSLNSSAREIASTIREAYNSTVLLGEVHRIVYDLKENAFWAEAGPRDALLDTKETREKEERRNRFSRKTNKAEGPSFKLAKAITRKKLSLPRGVRFEDIISEQSPEPIIQGKAYTHFFPNGLTEQTVVHLRDSSDHHVTLFISALIGRTKVVERYVKDEDAYEEESRDR